MRIKMEPDKEHVRHYLLFCFHQKEKAADACRIICETYGEKVIVIKMRIDLNNLKTVISISVTKNAPGVLEKDELRKDGKKS